MVNLEAEDRKQLITLLKDLPELATERSRQQILELAGLKQLIPMINLSGASFRVLHLWQLVRSLAIYLITGV
ncbi:hypothetical protein [Nostoc sp.]|uniref:hypothetical protein n=1 Tax=Nostoc sp. TaxID=1180 RepID=UPI002FEEE062